MSTESPDPRAGELVSLAVLVNELDIRESSYGVSPVDRLAGQLNGQVVLDDLGLRCCTAEAARALIAERDRQQAERAELMERNRRAMAAEQAKRAPVRGGITWEAAIAAGYGSPDEALMVQMAEDRPTDPVGIPRPGSNPWTFQEGGGSIGPRPSQRARRKRKEDGQ